MSECYPNDLSCLLSFDEKTKLWLGHCLDFNLVTSGATENEAWKNLRAVVAMHIEHCLTHHNHSGLQHSANASDWRAFEALAGAQEHPRRNKIMLNLGIRVLVGERNFTHSAETKLEERVPAQ